MIYQYLPLVAFAMYLNFGIASTVDTLAVVPTFHCLGLYWSPKGGAKNIACQVKYRPAGEATWKMALPLWFDD
ncbi:MAG: hypothetical protein ACRENG_16335, partial [bacterium]